MIEIEILRKKILDSLKTERKQFLISNKSNTDEKKNKNTHNHVRNIDLNNLYTLEKSELIFLSIDYTKKGKIKKALEVALEIDDAEYLWAEHYDNMISETISYCDKKNDYNILDKLSLIAIQFSALQDYLEYGKSADEIISLNIHAITKVLFNIFNFFESDKKKCNQILNQIFELYKYLERSSFFVDPLTLYFSLQNKFDEVGLEKESLQIGKKIISIINEFNSESNLLHHQFFIVNTFQINKPDSGDWYKMIDSHEDNDPWSISRIEKFSSNNKELITYSKYVDYTEKNIRLDYIYKKNKSNNHNSLETPLGSYNAFGNRNCGQFGGAPFLTIKTVAAAIKSNLLNLLFFRHCQIDEVFQAKDAKLMNKSINLANSIVDNVIRNRAYQLISSIYCDAAFLDNIDNENAGVFLERAFYWASVVSDIGEMRCFCGKYSGERYKGIKCDMCEGTCTNDGYKKNSFNYIFNALEKKKSGFRIDQKIFEKLASLKNENFEIKLSMFFLKSLLINNYPKSFSEAINERVIFRYKHSLVNEYIQDINCNLDQWANQNLIKSKKNWYKHDLTNYDSNYNELIKIEDEESWKETSIFENLFEKNDVWEEVPPYLEQWTIDKNGTPDNEFKNNFEFNYLTGLRNEFLEYKTHNNQVIHDDNFIFNSISNYINDENFMQNIQFSISNLLNMFLKLLAEYYQNKGTEFLENCMSDYIKILGIISDRKLASNFYDKLMFIIINNKDYSKYKLANNINFKSGIQSFTNNFVKEHSFKDSIIKNRMYKDAIKSSLSKNILIKHTDDLDLPKNKFIYLSNFYSFPKSIEEFLKLELQYLISKNKIKEIKVFEAIFNIE